MSNYEIQMNKIYSLKKENKFHEAAELVYDNRTKKLKGIFNYDKNHSWYVLGDLLIHLNLINDAIVAFKRALSAHPKDWQALFAIGNCYSNLKKNSLAQRYFSRALEIRDDDPSILYNIGNSYFDQKKYTEAIEFYCSAIKFDREGGIRDLASKNLEKARSLSNKEVKKQ